MQKVERARYQISYLTRCIRAALHHMAAQQVTEVKDHGKS